MPADQRAKYEENELKNLKKNAPKPPKWESFINNLFN